MNIDWAHFTPFASLTGGIILGIASAIFILVTGRILGISGIVGIGIQQSIKVSIALIEKT